VNTNDLDYYAPAYRADDKPSHFVDPISLDFNANTEEGRAALFDAIDRGDCADARLRISRRQTCNIHRPRRSF